MSPTVPAQILRVAEIVRASDIGSLRVQEFLDSHFRPELVDAETRRRIVFSHSSQPRNLSLDMEGAMEFYAAELRRDIPTEDTAFLNFVSRASNYFYSVNHRGRFCSRFVWPLFFERFPSGSVLVLILDPTWNERTLSEGIAFAKRTSLGGQNFLPQEMSGLLSAEFPNNVLLLPCLGVYPLFCGSHCATPSDVIFVYVPDRQLEHSQMLDSGCYTNVLWMMHHVLDDQWTFDGSRGPKSKGPGLYRCCGYNPLFLLRYRFSLPAHE